MKLRTPVPGFRDRGARWATAAVAAVAVSVSVPSPASAHVRIDPQQAAPGSYATLTFRVPTESATASTTKLVVDLPLDHPFGSVDYRPVPGWSVRVTTQKLAKPVKTDDATITSAPAHITWTASKAAAIRPGQFQTFSVVAGPVPDTTDVLFKAHQTYSDGKTVDWDQSTPANGSEPEHPAPALYITGTPPGGQSAGSASTSTPDRDIHDSTARWYGVGGLALGAAALVVSVVSAGRRRRDA